MNNAILIGVLIVGVFFGGFGTKIIDKVNPFKLFSKNKTVQQQESSSEIYYKDKVKGIEYQEKTKNKENIPTNTSQTIGTTIGNFIDKSLQYLIWFIIISLLIFYFTGFKTWEFIKKLKNELKIRDKVLLQTTKGIQSGKKELNGNKQKLLDALEKAQDQDVQDWLKKFKIENRIE